MAAGKYNILIQQGADFIQQLTIYTVNPDGTRGDPQDLTGCTIRGMVRIRFEDTDPIATFVIQETDLANGTFTLTLSNTVTAALDFQTGVYDVEVQYPNTVVDRVLQGTVVFSREVTR